MRLNHLPHFIINSLIIIIITKAVDFIFLLYFMYFYLNCSFIIITILLHF